MKKVLAWAVALALVLSSFTMAFAADAGKTSKDFSDADQIHYTEAVDVMVATGIINGFPDGTFGPQKTVKRSEMAKMIACIMNGGEDVGDQYKSACPFKDSQNHWAAGYIAFCASEHIIDGRSADVFDPEATVTGTEVAKMALTSLGYDSKIQGYTGENWAAAVLKDAKKNNLFEGLDSSFVPGDPCDRECAAQILFNMLKATEVEYTNGTSVSIGDDISVVVDSKAEPVTKKVGDKEVEVPLYEDVFGGKLAKNDDKGDAFGNPGHTWTYPDEETPVGTYTDDVSYEFVAEGAGFTNALKAYDEDLAEKYTADPKEIDVVSWTVNGGQGNADSIGLGDTVKMYKDDNSSTPAVEYKVVVEQYVAYQITKVNTEVTPAQAKKGVTALVTLETKATGYSNITAKEDTKIAGFDADTYVEKAVVAVALKGNDVIDSYVMEELASGTITKIKGNAVTIDGTAYDKATKYNAVDGVALAAKKDFTLYDYNGYALASTEVTEATVDPEVFYGVFIDKKTDTNSTGWSTDVPETKQLVRIFTAEGQMEEFTLAEKETIPSGIVNETGTSVTVTPTLISYQKNENGEIKAIAKATDARGWTNEPVATGDVLYGRELSEEIVAFANVNEGKTETAEDGTVTPLAPKWTVYTLDDLKEAKKVDIDSYFENTKDAKLVAIKCKSLEPEEVKDEVLGFLTKSEEITNEENKPALDLTLLVDGTETPITTKADVALPANALYSLVVVEKDGALAKAVRLAECTGVTKASDPIPDAKQAVFYGEGSKAAAYVFEVIGVSGNSLNIGTAAVDAVVDNPDTPDDETAAAVPAYNKYQTCTDAKVYLVEADGNGYKVTVSSLDKIEKGNFVVLMKTKKESKVWDTVIVSKTNPTSGTANEWAKTH